MLYLVWNPDIEIFRIGNFPLLWYGVLFALGLVAAGFYINREGVRIGISDNQLIVLVLLLFAGIFLGARLCHCIFYDPDYFFSHPVEIFLPISKNADGAYYFCGYHGLASHGGGVGAILALVVFKMVYKKINIWQLLDIVAIATPLLGGFIRVGNFFNSEILGTATTVPWAVVFASVDDVPRHPAQLYESVFYFSLFFILAAAYDRCANRQCGDIRARFNVKPGFWFSIVVIFIQVFRFLIEYCKVEQINFSADLPLNMGQLLCIPLFFVGILALVFTQWVKK